MERRYASHPNEVKQYDTERLRKEFHIPVLFTPDKLELVLTHEDRMIIGGAAPVQEQVKLETDLKELRVPLSWNAVSLALSILADMVPYWWTVRSMN